MNAVRAGKHVLVEKPLGVCTQECENLRLLVPPNLVFARLAYRCGLHCETGRDDGIAVVKTMVAISHSARQGGDWVGVGDVEGDLEHSFLKRSELTHASPFAYHHQKESQRSGHHSRLTNGSDALQPD